MARKIAPMKIECEAAFAPAAYNQDGGMRTFKAEEVKRLIDALGFDIKTEFPAATVPIGLRWRVSPGLGLPITPFTLYRKEKKTSLVPEAIVLAGMTNGVAFQNGPFFRVMITVKNSQSSPANYTIAPLDAEFQDYNGKKQFFNSIAAGNSFSFLVDQPYLGGLRINGGGFQITAATGITMLNYVNDPAWKRIQIVGLPFTAGSIDETLYSTTPQGYINALQTPDVACRQRADIYKLFYKDPPPTAPDGVAIPLWKVPTGTELVKSYQQTVALKNCITGTLNDIKEMLTQVYKTAPDLLLGLQENYVKEMQTLGVVDPANPAPQEDGTFQHPVCAATILTAATDCWHALGLGFGTIDFLPLGAAVPGIAAIALPGNIHAFDYMISATFRTPVLQLVPEQEGFAISYKLKFKNFVETEYATISHFDIQNPLPPSALQADTIGQNRPLVRDDNDYEHVRLSWQRPPIQDRSPLCYAIAFKNNTGPGTNIKFLNQERPFIAGKNMPYVPALRADENAVDPPGRDGSGFERFHHDRSAVPFVGSLTQQYYTAAQNVFGTWSNWSVASHVLVARPPQTPRVISAQLTGRHEGVNNHIYPGSQLEIVLAWDWEDRTPFEIQLAGYFVSPPNPNPPVTVQGVVVGNSGGSTERYRIRFSGNVSQLFKLDAANNLVPVPSTEGDVKEDPSASAGSSNGLPSVSNTDLRTYRVTLKNFNLDFSSTTKLYFTVYARAAEAKNPGAFSPFSKPVVITAADPVPRNPPLFVPDIKFATLPDANNISRFHLTFNPVPGAVSYAVYLATEMSLKDRLLSIVNYPKDESIFKRRDALNLPSTNAADRNRAIDAFTRVNKKPLFTPDIELELNGDTQGLFIYAVSSFTDQGAESKLSDWIYVAIPEKITPGPPSLLGFVNKKLVTPKAVLKLNVGAGNNTATIELYRTTKEYLGADVNMMGLPVSVGPTAGWTKFRITDGVNDEVVTDPAKPFDYFKVEENIPAGWAPLYYRAVSQGINEPANGKLPGRSPASNLLELLPPPPAAPPALNAVTLVANSAQTQLRLSFRSNAYVGKSPHGNHTALVFKQAASGLFEPMAGGDLPAIKKLEAGVVEPPNTLVRLPGIDATGFSTYALNFPLVEKVTLKVAVADPFGRKTESIVTFTRPVQNIVIGKIAVKRTAGAVNLNFKTKLGKTKPPAGQYTLSILLRAKVHNVVKQLFAIAMHQIPDNFPFFPNSNAAIAGGRLQDADGFFTYEAVFRGVANLNAFTAAKSVIIRLTDVNGNVVEKEQPII
ncbi:hypothetical protein [Flavisolibacter nicotianae]|uniref:hypothetical protein n=1 Tax=Flavisolibacter nicotianae TaxID=2364882 RepID=UPI000EB2ABBC|nr:hypothetical protein [Flavisolibacter nicotianae]